MDLEYPFVQFRCQKTETFWFDPIIFEKILVTRPQGGEYCICLLCSGNLQKILKSLSFLKPRSLLALFLRQTQHKPSFLLALIHTKTIFPTCFNLILVLYQSTIFFFCLIVILVFRNLLKCNEITKCSGNSQPKCFFLTFRGFSEKKHLILAKTNGRNQLCI